MRVLFVTPYYAPDLGPSSPLVTMLCEDFVTLGHQVTVLAAVPHFPSGHVPAEYRRQIWHWETQNGVRVCRVLVPSGDRGQFLHRALVFVVYQILSMIIGLAQSYDVVIITNPAIETGLPFTVLSVLRRKPAIFCVWDVYPEAGVKLGIFRHSFVISIVKALEDFCLLRSQCIQVLSPQFSDTLVKRGISPKKIVLIPVWLDTDFLQPQPRHNDFARESKLDGHFVVMYAGNHGHSQALDTVLQAAQLLETERAIHFLFVGDGINKPILQSHAHQMGLKNITFISFQPRERLPEMLASADVALIPLKRGLGQDSLPSKVFPILACGKPMVVSVDEDCELADLVRRAGAGICVAPESPQEIANAILSLYASSELCKQLGSSGREYAIKHHSRDSAVRQFEYLLLNISTPKSQLL